MKKVDINEEDIIIDYANGTGLSMKDISKKYHIHTRRVSEIIRRHGISIKRYHNSAKENTERFPKKEGYYYVAIDPKTGFSTKDYLNLAGMLTSYIHSQYGVDIPSHHIREKYRYENNGKYWWEQWLEIREIKEPEKKALTELSSKEVIHDYLNTPYGIEHLSKIYHVGKLRIKKILEENNIPIKKKGAQGIKGLKDSCKYSSDYVKYKNEEGYTYQVFDLNSGDFITNDFTNKAGIISNFLHERYNIFPYSSNEAKRYLMATGNYWYEKYVEIRKVPINKQVKAKKCPICGWETTDIHNKAGIFAQHLKQVHHLTVEDYLKAHPEDKDYLTTYVQNVKEQRESNPDNFVECKLCGKRFSRLKEHVENVHNISIKKYQELFPDAPIVCKNLHETMSDIVTEMNKTLVIPHSSKMEDTFYNNLVGYGINVQKGNKSVLGNGQEIDLYCSDDMIAIEYNGARWHTELHKKGEDFHANKTNICESKGIHLIQIFDDDYRRHGKVIWGRVQQLFQAISSKMPVIYSDRCIIKEVNYNQAVDFIDNYGIIESIPNDSINIGAYFEDRLVAMMCFKKIDDCNYELVDYSFDYEYKFNKVCSKLFSYFMENYKPSKIVAIANREWTMDWYKMNFYTAIGFKKEKVLKPDYMYFKFNGGKDRIPKEKITKDFLLENGAKEYPSISDMANSIGYYRVFDCGYIKYVYDVNKKKGNSNA